MINIYIYFIMMFLMFVMMFILSLEMYFLDLGVFMEWMIYSLNSVNIEFVVLLDWVSTLFISLVSLISSMVILYSGSYMGEEKFLERFIHLVMMFVFSMILMIISPNVVSILFGWDGLGLTSYCLVIFYQNYSSYNSGMVTVLSNRIGDVGLLMSVSLMMFKGSWNFWSLESSLGLGVVMVLIAAMTKSAQIPFSTWLPMAMAAPTPVSALVHSSTLVTAGVYLMIRFNDFLIKSGISMILFFFSVLTMFMSGLMAIVESDLKKIIALSTLSQLGLMMMILSMGAKMGAYFHLLTHAIFKSMLFMCAGIIIHLMMSSQDIRLLGNLNESLPFTMMSFYIANLSLCGTPFMAGFYSKDYIMEMIYSMHVNTFMLSLIIFSLMFTVMYSMRLFYYMFFGSLKFYSFSSVRESEVNFSLMMLMLLSIFIGSMLSWMFFSDFYMIFLSFWLKMLTLLSCGMGVLMMVILLWSNLSKGGVGLYYLNNYLGSMWFLNYLYLWIYCPVNYVGVSFWSLDKTWGEFFFYSVKEYILESMGFSFFKMNLFIVMFVSGLMIIFLMM